MLSLSETMRAQDLRCEARCGKGVAESNAVLRCEEYDTFIAPGGYPRFPVVRKVEYRLEVVAHREAFGALATVSGADDVRRS